MKTFYQYLESQNATRFAPSAGDWEDSSEEDYKDKDWIHRHDKQIDDNDDVNQMYSNYEKSMNRRRPGVALNFGDFLNRINDQNTYNFRIGDSIVFGSYKNGIFFPTHFSPSSLRQGRTLLKELLKYRVVWAVTPDISNMIASLGYIKIISGVPMNFRGGTVYKDILVSSRKIIPEVKKMFSSYSKAA